MQGLGTKTDPFLIETWDDFFSGDQNGYDAHYMLANDLDGNDYNGGLFTNGMYVPCNLDGNGHRIVNVASLPGATSSVNAIFRLSASGLWKNVVFENLAVASFNALFDGSNTGVSLSRFESCSFSGVLARGFFNATTHGGKIEFRKCAFALSVGEFFVTAKNPSAGVFEICDIDVTFTGNSIHYLWMSFTIHATRLIFKVRSKVQPSSASLGLESHASVIVFEMPQDIEYTTEYSVKTYDFDPTPSIFDATTCGIAPIVTSGNTLRLTTEQMQNADYLNSIGFPVVRVS